MRDRRLLEHSQGHRHIRRDRAPNYPEQFTELREGWYPLGIIVRVIGRRVLP
jgi:hypothetical protein